MPHNWIRKLNASNSRLHKEKVIGQALASAQIGANDAHIFLLCAVCTNNPFMRFHVKRVPVTEGIVGKNNPFDEFWVLLRSLETRVVTGNAALEEIDRVSKKFNSDVWNELLRPTILKDLRVGATVKTFNKVCKGTQYETHVFEAQLAVDSEKKPKAMKGRKFLEPKLDGVRVLALVVPSTKAVTLYSRSGKVFNNFEQVEKNICNALQYMQKSKVWHDTKLLQGAFILDGEIVSENFQALMKQARRKTDIDTSDSVYTIFDVIPAEKFANGIWKVTQRERSETLLADIRKLVNDNCPSLHVINGIEVDLDTAEGWSVMERYGKDMVADGYEGIMIKNVDAPYKCKRGDAWMKWKPTITVDLEIVDMEEGTGRNEGRLGALVCEGTDQGRDIQVNVGSGLSDKQRDEFWTDKDKLIGHIVEIKADVVTQNENGTYSLRFPRFLRFRDIEAGEKL